MSLRLIDNNPFFNKSELDIILCISDTQFPFHHQDCFAFLYAIKNKYEPRSTKFTVIHQGDEVDFHALGDWDHDPDGYSAGDELNEAIKSMKILYDMFPTCHVCVSNHTARPLRKAFKAGIPKAFIREYHDFLKAPPGWVWSDKWKFNDIIFEHGENVSGKYAAINAAIQNRQSTVIGHIHSFGGVTHIASYKDVIFGMNTGCLIDHTKYAFKYASKSRIKPTLGCGLIINGIPVFIPMIVDKNNRWVGVIP